MLQVEWNLNLGRTVGESMLDKASQATLTISILGYLIV
jgi:hypothetical protein